MYYIYCQGEYDLGNMLESYSLRCQCAGLIPRRSHSATWPGNEAINVHTKCCSTLSPDSPHGMGLWCLILHAGRVWEQDSIRCTIASFPVSTAQLVCFGVHGTRTTVQAPELQLHCVIAVPETHALLHHWRPVPLQLLLMRWESKRDSTGKPYTIL